MKKNNTLLQRGRAFLAFTLGIGLLIGILTFQRPMEVYAAIDPGLDSGNATIDRTSVPGQTILKYTTTGNSTFKAPAGVTNVRVLVVGGGGGGGAGESNAAGDAGGGGGAGEYIHQTSTAVTPGAPVTVTVGGGGAGSQTNEPNGGTTAQNGASGGNSVFSSLTARGGGGGGGNDQGGLAGGSGGGAGGRCTSGALSGGASTAVAPGVGKAGGSSPAGSCTPRGAAGGGGAAVAGSSGSGGNGGIGGTGLQNDVTGTNAFYAAGGGGGGGKDTGTGANGGSSIGGKGGNASGGNGAAGTANTGSGGGGGGSVQGTGGGKGGAGSSGIVIVRFATQDIINPNNPAGVSGATMWYKADSAGNTNAQWNDSSGFGYNITQGTASKQPVLTPNSINFNPAYMFDGTDDVFRMDGHGIGSTQPMSAFFGANLTRTDGGYRYLNEFGDDSPSLSLKNGNPDLYVRTTSPITLTYPTAEALVPHVYSFISPNASGSANPRIVGVDYREETQTVNPGTYTTSSPNGQPGNSFGGTNGSGGVTWAGPIAEAIYFNKVLTPAERQQINSYLAIKYGVTLGTGSTAYLASDGSTIYPADATFKNNIAGIGRDDASTLNQKQSKSTSTASDIVTIGNGTIATDNQANTNNFTADRSFQVWGHNGAATNTNTTVTGTTYIRMNRIWKTVKTNTVGQVKVQIPTSAVTGGSNGVMFISSSATFDQTSQRVNMTLNGSNYEANVTLPAGTNYFTFGSLTGSDIEMVSKVAQDTGGGSLTGYTPGEDMVYILTVKNNGPDNAGLVTVTDTLPAGLVPISATGGGWNCPAPSGQTVTCTRPALNSGVTAPTISIAVDIASNVTGAKSNTATASVANDPDTTNNNATLNLPAAPKADLSIAKRHTNAPVAGQQLHYELQINNNGPSDVSSFTITDTLNSNLTFASSSSNLNCSGSPLTCTYTGSPVTANSTVTATLTVNVSGSYPGGDISNTATIAPPTGTTDPNMSNNSSTDNTTILVSTQLGITKTPSGTFTAGENNNTFTLAVSNQGPSNAPANSVTISDTLDEDFTFVSATSTGNFWSCSGVTTITCTNTGGAITAGGSAPDLIITVSVDPIAKSATTNTADLSSTTPDPDLSDNSSTANITIASEADLGITKASVGSLFTAGAQEKYTLTVVNNGPSADSPSYTISDTLPATLTFVGTEPGSAATCSAVNQLVTCTGGAIGVSETQVTTITVTVSGSATGPIANTATVAPAAGTNDPVAANDSSTSNVNVEPNADLSISKTHTGNLTAGANATYTLTTHNAGPSNVASYTVTDMLDSDLTFVSSVPNGACSPTGPPTPAGEQEITCNGGAITSGSDGIITITVTVEPTVTPGSTIANTATVAAPAGVNDPDMTNNSSTVTNTVDASADLEVTKTHIGDFTAGSNTNTFNIAVTNNGPSDASTFTLTDTLPAELTYVSATGPGVGCINASQTVTCTYGPIIAAGQTVNITLTVGVGGSQAGGSTIDNTASVSSATPDPTSGNNSDTDTATVDSIADLGITKTNDTDFTAGSDEDYTIQVTNAGPSNAAAFTVSDTLPADLTFVESIPNGLCTNPSGQDVVCNGGALASGGNTSFKIKVHTDSGLAPGTVITNTATVATVAPTTDPNSANNSSTDPTTIVTVTDLSIQKNPTGTYVAGETGQFTFTVNNAGPSNAPAGDVEVTDALPTGLTFASGTGTGWDCSGSSVGGQDVSCIYTPSLAVSATTPVLTVTVNIAPDKQGEVTNTGTVVSTLDDSTPANDTDSATVDITAEADLTATKTPQGTLTAGENITYRFEVTNDGGPSDANDVTITDNLQGHYTYQSFNAVSGGTWDCSEASGTVTCDLSTPLAVDGTAIVDVTLTIAEAAPNPLENTASVTFNGTDPSPANPTTSDPVSYSADLEVDITHEQKTYRSGDTVNMTYTIINHGPSAAQNVVMTSTIPSGFTVTSVSATAPGGSSILASLDNFFFPRASAAANPFTCSLSGQQLTCNASTLFVGTYPLYITGKISNSFTGQMVFAAHIASSTPDPNLSDVDAIDVISGILPGLGLAGTGQKLWPWIAGTLVILLSAIVLVRRLQLKKNYV